jgi:hypothetical protein
MEEESSFFRNVVVPIWSFVFRGDPILKEWRLRHAARRDSS